MNFLKYTKLYFTLSGLMILISLISLWRWGLTLDIDFTGGSLVELRTNGQLSEENIRPVLKQLGQNSALVQSAGKQQILIKTNQLDQNQVDQLLDRLMLIDPQVELLRFETIGPTLGQELIRKTLLAIGLSVGFITFYLAWTFKDIKYGVSAILAMLHDTFILIGSFSVLGHLAGVTIDTLFVTAVLTTLSFSVHDTIVVYDRIRESRRLLPRLDLTTLANKALTETMTRSLNNSFTIIFMLTALTLLGGETIRYFALALLIGTILGTYSSPFVAVPILIRWQSWANSRNKS